MRHRWLILGLCLLSAGWERSEGPRSCDWSQWGQSPLHQGASCAAGQDATRELAHVAIDPFARQELTEDFSLVTHYQVPLTDDEDVFVLQKAGRYVNCDPPGSGQPFPCGDDARNTQIWTEKAMHWDHGQLVDRWTFTSDWKPMPNQFEPMFQPALGRRFIYIPGAGGSVYQVDKRDGSVRAQVKPFGDTLDPNTYVSGGITVDDEGNIYYNAIRLDAVNPASDVHGAWLVKVTPHGRIVKLDYTTLIPDAPRATDQCFGSFLDVRPRPPLPWPPPDQAAGVPTLPPRHPCLSQRPGFNVTPAIGDDGTIFTVTHAHGTESYSYLVALRPDLSLKWASSLRDHLFDGCGVTIPYDPAARFFVCRPGASFGVDPFTNLPGAGEAVDIGSSSPTALPDGSVLYGAETLYNDGGAGHLFKFDRHGEVVATTPYGWDTTAAIYRHDHTYSIILKQNRFLSNEFFIKQLDPNLGLEWQFQATNSVLCERQPDGSVFCFDSGVPGFEWCVNAPAVDRNGTVYVTNEDGNFYAIGQGGVELQRHFLSRSVAASYTPVAIDRTGRIYVMNNGDLYVLGR